MGTVKEIEDLISRGYVLDDSRNWVSIVHKIKHENDFIKHLESGEVLHNGQWISITAAKEFQNRKKLETISNALQSHNNFAIGTTTEETVAADVSGYEPETVYAVYESVEPTDDKSVRATNEFAKHRDVEDTASYVIKSDLNSSSLFGADSPGAYRPRRTQLLRDSRDALEIWETARRKRRLIIGLISGIIVTIGAAGAFAFYYLL